MNDTNKNDGAAENLSATAADDAELRALDERMAELRARGIISGGEGPRGSLRAIAHVPGALERFLKRRD
ncbi:MAG: hypothetical protein OXL37_07555 [Chloroflexota bacterium]|nr:hypothetical protein [Chloroflexota bacterium]MDE2959398.1 hypothetical protein [Chloroflexota bacterium]